MDARAETQSDKNIHIIIEYFITYLAVIMSNFASKSVTFAGEIDTVAFNKLSLLLCIWL